MIYNLINLQDTYSEMIKMPVGISNIEHDGVIGKINKNKITVHFIAHEACAGCRAQSVCSVAGHVQKEVEVLNQNTDEFNIGEKVRVVLSNTMGLRAVLYAYLIPFFLILTLLIVLLEVFNNELKAGLFSLLGLIPYYSFLYFHRKKLINTFKFIIEKKKLNE